MTFTRRSQPLVYTYQYEQSPLVRVETVKDLGVTLDHALTFHDHVNRIVQEALHLFALLRRFGRDLFDPHAILQVYIGLVRSKMEFASVVWRPQYAGQIQRLEGVQKKFVKFALRNLPWSGDHMPCYQDLCGLVDLDTLFARHRIADIVFFTNVITGRVSSEHLRAKIQFNHNSTNLRQRRIFDPPLRTRNYLKHEPVIRFMHEFNGVKNVISLDMTTNVIKNKLRLFTVASCTNCYVLAYF